MIKYNNESIQRVIKSIKDDAAGNCPCTMTDLDLACDMLEEYIRDVTELRARLDIADPDDETLSMLYDEEGNLIQYG